MMDIKPLLGAKTLKIISVAYTLCITFLLLFPATHVPKIDVPSFDKLGHILVFSLLVILWALFAFMKSKEARDKIWWVVIATFIYGIVIEALQWLFLESRTADVWDIVANSAGIFLGWLIFRKIKNYLG
ncbi:MAG: VanZ family protein [Bacteroidota bacterium]